MLCSVQNFKLIELLEYKFCANNVSLDLIEGEFFSDILHRNRLWKNFRHPCPIIMIALGCRSWVDGELWDKKYSFNIIHMFMQI